MFKPTTIFARRMHTSSPAWSSPPAQLELSLEVLHVWRLDVDDRAHDVTAATRLLSEDERQRAFRFRFARDRHRFVIGRALLRIILSRYLQADPARLRFAYNEYGKPSLIGDHAGLQFNISNSASLAVCAVVLHGAVGIDVEHVRDLSDIDRVARHFFAAPEAQIVRALSGPNKTMAFFTCWTRKEAYIKALGTGLSRPLDSFAVTCLPEEPAGLAWVADDPREIERWSFESFTPSRDYIAAVAVEGPRRATCYWRSPHVRRAAE
jgi:4'-phosphopantetheinyl transferase